MNSIGEEDEGQLITTIYLDESSGQQWQEDPHQLRIVPDSSEESENIEEGDSEVSWDSTRSERCDF